VNARPGTRRRLPIGLIRRNRPVRRSASGRARVRAGAALIALASAAAIYGVASSSAFDYARLRVQPQPVYTDPNAVEQALDFVRGANLFRLDTTPLQAAILNIRTIDSARVSVELPDTLVVTLRERQPILIWAIGARRYLVDDEGNLFAKLDGAPAATSALPVIDDERASSAGLSIGVTLDPVDLDAATRLGSVLPGDVGSTATSLSLTLTDENGFVMKAKPIGWFAIFGFYTPTLRTPALIPGQVRLLRSLIIGRESIVERVILASDTDGTYVPRPSPTPSATPSDTPKPTTRPTAKPTASGTPSPSPKP
jgi:cell division septal protein FtsQ